MGDVTKHMLVSGQVQGVGFRHFTTLEAKALKLQGWVRNLKDGRVEILVRGDLSAVEQLESAVKKGPPTGHVDAVKVRELTSSEVLAAFETAPTSEGPWQDS